jgi:gamma-glutamylputrescine oxidase
MTVSYWQDAQESKVHENADVAIIGGGIGGATAAYWLSKRKGLKVVLLEAQKVAAGASGRDAGFAVRTLFAYYNQAISIYGKKKAQWLLKFNEDSLGYLGDIAKDYGGERFSFNKCGSYLLACSPAELKDLDESAQLMTEDGFAVECLSRDPLERGYLGALFNPGDVSIHTSNLVKLLLEVSNCKVLEGPRGGASLED